MAKEGMQPGKGERKQPQRLQTFLLWLSTLVIAITIAVPVYKEFAEPGPKAVAGVLDLTSWDADGSDIVKLNGEWAFYWSKLLEPADFAGPDGGGLQQPVWTNVPSSWDSVAIDGKRLPAVGYATYRLRVLMPVEHGIFGVKTSNIRAANRIFVNGELIGQSGNPAASPDAIVHRNTPYAGYFEINAPTVDIIVQVASFKSFNSGIVQAISFGNQHAVSSFNNYNNALDGGLAWGFLTMAVYFIGIYFQRRPHRELLFFGLCCLATMLFLMTHSERLLTQLFPQLSIEVQLYIEDIAAILMAYFFSRYVYHSFPGLYPKRLLRGLEVAAGSGIVLVLFTTASYNGPFVLALSLSILVVMLTNSYYMAKAAKQAEDGSAYLYIGILGTLDFVVVNFLNNIWKLEEHYIFPAALPIVVLSQALYMSKQYTRSFQTIQDLSDRLSALDKLKDEFLAKTSHELKTPLNGIINISQSLLAGAGGGLNAVQSSDLKLVVDTGKRLSTLVNDILDYSKMKNRDLQLRFTHFDCCMVVDVAIEMLGHSIRNKPLALVNRLPRREFVVYADENRFMQIVYNLLDNAIKYTPAGEIAISAKREDGFVQVTVSDTGIGIPADQFAAVFTSFEQLEPSLTRSHGGVGLGLAITQQLVELHGGTIRVRSEVGVGTQMTFSVPAGRSDRTNGREADGLPAVAVFGPGSAAAQTAVAAPASPERERQGAYAILAVDDDYSSLKAMANLLAVEGYAVTTAANGEEALRALSSGRTFDLCILDIMMPGMSGYEVCRIVRERYSLLEQPILLVTAKSQYNDLAAGLAAGANDFLEKPYDHAELKSRVGTLVQLKQSADELVRKELSFLQAQIKPHFIYNTLNAILAYSYSDHPRSRKLLHNFSTYLRNCFDFKETTAFVPLEQELALLQAYVEIEKARFLDMLEVSIQVDPEMIGAFVPPLVIQPLAENAIYHGIMKKENGGRLTVSVGREHDMLRIEVADDGVGMASEAEEGRAGAAAAKRKGVALDNIRKRLYRLYGSELVIRSEAGKGTVVSMTIPLGGAGES
ncbi:hybrid sensor histidine kinase/response regulator [Paenibacillus cymbidii]|uniref:hybrid sensor histidine kinase/response regulator n=1 Tax=Paenibacillus cymbidii TaxID=1639034 RepID=UPI0010814BEC|nr:ATP-binding protein [Paenibacillus cymbidii]